MQAADFLQDSITVAACAKELAATLLTVDKCQHVAQFMTESPEPVAIAILSQCLPSLSTVISILPDSLLGAACHAAVSPSARGL